MNLAICTIQRDRGRWLREWIAFHSLVGFKKFYIYLHKCSDNSQQVISELSRQFDIDAYVLDPEVHLPQLSAYQHCYVKNGARHDWIAFIDGDEFLFSPNKVSVADELEVYKDKQIGAIGVYWACFGSSGHITEPDGLITENYRFRAPDDFSANGHVKSIVKGGMGNEFSVLNNSHIFQTRFGTYDTLLRQLTGGYSSNIPCWNSLRINHYVTQSYSYFKNFKKISGAADADPNWIRSEDWWLAHDKNDIYDESLMHIHPYLRELLE